MNTYAREDTWLQPPRACSNSESGSRQNRGANEVAQRGGGIFIELMTSDCKLKASSEGSKKGHTGSSMAAIAQLVQGSGFRV